MKVQRPPPRPWAATGPCRPAPPRASRNPVEPGAWGEHVLESELRPAAGATHQSRAQSRSREDAAQLTQAPHSQHRVRPSLRAAHFPWLNAEGKREKPKTAAATQGHPCCPEGPAEPTSEDTEPQEGEGPSRPDGAGRQGTPPWPQARPAEGRRAGGRGSAPRGKSSRCALCPGAERALCPHAQGPNPGVVAPGACPPQRWGPRAPAPPPTVQACLARPHPGLSGHIQDQSAGDTAAPPHSDSTLTQPGSARWKHRSAHVALQPPGSLCTAHPPGSQLCPPCRLTHRGLHRPAHLPRGPHQQPA